MQTINITVPIDWHDLTQKQLRYLYFLISEGYSSTAIKTLCLFRWSGLRVISQKQGQFYLRTNKNEFFVTALQIAEAITSLSWIDETPTAPVRLERIGWRKAVRADFQEVPFGTFIMCENLYQGFLHTQNEELLTQMARLLYGSRRIRLDKAERISIFYWFASLKNLLARTFPHFLQPATVGDGNMIGGTPNIGQRLQESMNAQIRALTKGDITKEKEILALDTWRALTELDAQAKTYEELNKRFLEKSRAFDPRWRSCVDPRKRIYFDP